MQTGGAVLAVYNRCLDVGMKQVIDNFIACLKYEKDASPRTIAEYRNDVNQFRSFLTPPGEKTLPLDQIDHKIIR
jgi:site-specific recombinase XerD